MFLYVHEWTKHGLSQSRHGLTVTGSNLEHGMDLHDIGMDLQHRQWTYMTRHGLTASAWTFSIGMDLAAKAWTYSKAMDLQKGMDLQQGMDLQKCLASSFVTKPRKIDENTDILYGRPTFV